MTPRKRKKPQRKAAAMLERAKKVCVTKRIRKGNAYILRDRELAAERVAEDRL